jgi:hypothetical protein
MQVACPSAISHERNQVLDNQAGNVQPADPLDSFQARGGIDFQHQRATRRAQQVNPGHPSPSACAERTAMAASSGVQAIALAWPPL